MNKTEERYSQYLDMLVASGDIESYKFEAVTFKLADRTSYLPDFYVVYKDHIELHEVKGYLTDKGRIKFNIAAAQFPEYKWVMIGYKNKKIGFEVIKEL
jgi:hypothetical protein